MQTKTWEKPQVRKYLNIQNIIAALFFMFVFMVLLSRAISIGISHDEFQFVAGAQLFRNSLLLPYVNYPFLHMPYMPIINGVLILFSKEDFLTIRLADSGFTFLSTLLIFSFVTGFLRSSSRTLQWVMGAIAVLLFISNPALVTMDGRALNHSLPILLSLIVFWILADPSMVAPSNRRVWICGFLAGIAMGIRLNYAVLIVLALVLIFWNPQAGDKKLKIQQALFLIFGFVIALLPAGLLFLWAPQPFLYGNIHYIILNNLYRANLSYADAVTLLDKLKFFFQNAFDLPTVLLYLGSGSISILALIRWFKFKNSASYQILGLAIFSLALLATGFTPTPPWPQYFFAPIPFLILLLFRGIAWLLEQRMKTVWLISAAFWIAIFTTPFISEINPDFRQLSNINEWVPVKFHQTAEDILTQANCLPGQCKVLTFVPIFPLDVGRQTYPMFAVGSFSWRTAPLLSSERRKEYHIISYTDLPAFLAADPPTAILTGTEAGYDFFDKDNKSSLDQPLVDYAISQGYIPRKVPNFANQYEPNLTLYMKP
jgi:4-amino-4-deoxy-L-arabinose transferase-like glycosyltransferase